MNLKNNNGAERLLACLTMCHNILRSQEGMSSESAYRELNRLLFVKYIKEKRGQDNWRHSEDEDIQRVFDEVKQEFSNEHIYDYSETIISSPISHYDVLGLLHDFSFLSATAETGWAYETFVQKVLRIISDEPIFPHSVSESIVGFLDINRSSSVIAPNCGYGAFLSVMSSRFVIGRSGMTFGYEKDSMLAQTAKMNLLMHGNGNGRIERETRNLYHSYQEFDYVITCVKHRERPWEDISHAMQLLAPYGKAALLIPDDILQKEQFEEIRRVLVERHTVMAIVSLPAGAVKSRGRQLKWSVLYIQRSVPQDRGYETLLANVENIGVSSLGLPSEKNDFKEIEPSVYQWLHMGFKEKNSRVMWMNLSSLDSWNVEAEFLKDENRYVSQYPLYKLGDLADSVRVPIREGNNEDYKQVTVRINQHDVILRDQVTFDDIKYPRRQSVVRSGQMLISRINAKDGAIGIVPQELDGAIVSDNFIVLDIRRNIIDPCYLLMVLTSKRYQKVLKGISRGTTLRTYINIKELLDVEIPVPGIEKQLELTGDMVNIKKRIYQLEKRLEEGVDNFSKELFGV